MSWHTACSLYSTAWRLNSFVFATVSRDCTGGCSVSLKAVRPWLCPIGASGAVCRQHGEGRRGRRWRRRQASQAPSLHVSDQHSVHQLLWLQRQWGQYGVLTDTSIMVVVVAVPLRRCEWRHCWLQDVPGCCAASCGDGSASDRRSQLVRGGCISQCASSTTKSHTCRNRYSVVLKSTVCR